MKFKELIQILREHGVLVVTIVVLTVPPIWGLASLYYRERIETLREQVNLIREEKQFLEAKLKAPAEFSLRVSSPTSAGQSPGAPNITTEAVSVRYPPISNPSRPTKPEVRDLARFYGLFNEWKVNPHLRFKEGDVSYWYEQGLSEQALKREFESRRIILQRAETTGERIDTQGDLSHKAQEIQPQLTIR